MTKKDSNPIRVAALICVAITSAYLMWMGWKINEILASPSWCSRALQAERISEQNFTGIQDCVSLLTIQLKSLATNSHILFGVIALCLLVLIADPNRALDPAISAKVLVKGMEQGWFTGKKLGDYLGPPTDANFFNCRRIINGTDKAIEISRVAQGMLQALRAGGWS